MEKVRNVGNVRKVEKVGKEGKVEKVGKGYSKTGNDVVNQETMF